MLNQFLKVTSEKSYLVFREKDRGVPNLNIVGWRFKGAQVDRFDDFVAIYWEDDGKWKSRVWPATTRPGKPYLLSPINKKGTAILKPGQYLSAFRLGHFRGRLALRQDRAVTVYRDDDRDGAWDTTRTEIGMFGIHIHRPGVLSSIVGRNSAGCQVFQRPRDFDEFITIVSISAAKYGRNFTYTLLEF